MVMRRISRKCAAPATSLFTCQAPYFHSTPSRFQSKDYYKTLGVSRNASADDIKQAYKKKIKSLHPDVNADPRAAEEFAKVKEAAETLQDPQKKSMYDMSGGTGGMGGAASGFPGGASGFPGMGMPGFDPSKMGMGMGGAGGFNFGDFEEVLKGMGSKKDNVKKAQGPEPGSDVHYKLKLSFLEAVNGVSKEISYNTMRKCTGCAGSGNQESGSKGQCPHCGGKGKKVMSTGFFSYAARLH